MSTLDAAITARASFFDAAHDTAFRLFNHFSEGAPQMTLDVYQRCLLLHDYTPGGDPALRESVMATVRTKLPWLTSGVIKVRNGSSSERHGIMGFGARSDVPDRVRENGVWYAIDLLAKPDATFYLDSRPLRVWLTETMKNKRVLNTFAYSGSLSVAARAGGARQVVTTDRSSLDLAKRSFALNTFAVNARDFVVGDFFAVVSRLKRVKTLFDCVVLDPPFFAAQGGRRIDLQTDMGALINKVRPLVAHDGYLVLVNNAVFFSGAEYMGLLDGLCKDGFMTLEARLDVPPDCTGYEKIVTPPTDSAPFNHSTKIAVMRVTRKDKRAAS